MRQEKAGASRPFSVHGRNGNSQAVLIPAELAYSNWDMELQIERCGDELRIRPVRRRMGDVLGTLARFSDDFMQDGRGENLEQPDPYDVRLCLFRQDPDR